MMPNEQSGHVSLFELWLVGHPISDEFRRSLAADVASLAQSYRDRFKHQINGARIDNPTIDKKPD